MRSKGSQVKFKAEIEGERTRRKEPRKKENGWTKSPRKNNKQEAAQRRREEEGNRDSETLTEQKQPKQDQLIGPSTSSINSDKGERSKMKRSGMGDPRDSISHDKQVQSVRIQRRERRREDGTKTAMERGRRIDKTERRDLEGH